MQATQAESSTRTVRVLVSDAISEKGVEVLRSAEGFDVTFRPGLSPDELKSVIGDYDALIVRSATKVTPEVLARAGKLRVIGRAGTGVDNIHLETATNRGVVVMNTPGGNSVAAAEQTIALLTALARNVAPANADLRSGQWNRKKYTGIEITGKTMGIIGLGRIGREVARRARGLRMDVVGHDPFVSDDSVKSLGVTVLPFDELLAASDFVSLHLPLSPETRNLINASALAHFKAGARLINCARGGLVEEGALLQALESGRLAGAALDVFAEEPTANAELVGHPRVLATPHLGASTVEAQERVGTEICQKVVEYFQSGAMLDAVNFPTVGREEYQAVRPVMDLADRLGRFVTQVATGACRRLEVRCYGSFVDLPLKPIVMAATKGSLSPVLSTDVSLLNALPLAKSRGMQVDDGRSSQPTRFAGMLRLTCHSEHGGATTVAGTLYEDGRARLVEIDGTAIESIPDGYLLYSRNEDVPGVVGRIGSILGRAAVNIAGLQLGRIEGSSEALAIINLDQRLDDDHVDEIRSLPEILAVKMVHV